MELLFVIIFVGGILSIAFYSDFRKTQKNYQYQLEQNSIDSNNARKLIELIQNIFLVDELDLKNLSKLSRQFFDSDDLDKYGWEKTSFYDNAAFFEKEMEGPLNLFIPKNEQNHSNDPSRQLNRMWKKNWNEEGRVANQELMEARRNFFIKNFPKKLYSIASRYQLQENLSEDVVSIFIMRFSNLVKMGKA